MRTTSLADWPVARRLVIFIVASVGAALVFGGLRLARQGHLAYLAAAAAALVILLAEVFIARSLIASGPEPWAWAKGPQAKGPQPTSPQAKVSRPGDEQDQLRSSFNAMFVDLSRRSQSLTERLARMIDALEQAEDNPDRRGPLLAMDHLVTRMRRNSENLLLLAGHDNPRTWSDAVPLTDVVRAPTAEVEQYNRVTPGAPTAAFVIGSAVPDVVRLLAELIENATLFSPKEAPVYVSQQELASGGVLVEVIDQGIGVTGDRLAEMNWRLDNPPPIDVSVSRHMGLFVVARLAQRHRIQVRLRPLSPQGLSPQGLSPQGLSPRGLPALVWLPDRVLGRGQFSTGGFAADGGRSVAAPGRLDGGGTRRRGRGRSGPGRAGPTRPERESVAGPRPLAAAVTGADPGPPVRIPARRAPGGEPGRSGGCRPKRCRRTGPRSWRGAAKVELRVS